MSNPARVESIEALKMFRRAIIKFVEAANVALGDAESEMQRRLNWLENEQDSYWQGQIRKRQEEVSKCKDAVRRRFGFMALVSGSALFVSQQVEHDRENFRLRTPCLTR